MTNFDIEHFFLFDICLMNPPYGNRNVGDEFLHHKFAEKCLSICKKLICVMPSKLCTYDTSKDKKREYFKKLYDDRLIEVESLKSTIFSGTNMMPIGIHCFDINNNKNIHIIDDINKKKYSIRTLFDINQFNEYEKNIVKYLEIDIDDANCNLCQTAKNDMLLDKWLDRISKSKKKYYLTASSANGAMNGKWFSKTVGKVFSNIDDLKNNFKDRNGAACIVMLFDSLKSAENCRTAMKNPLLRFCLYKSQDDQNLRRKVYKYIPNIDWKDPRVKTDEGLLEVCGCPIELTKEYAEYCKDIIEKVDKGERP